MQVPQCLLCSSRIGKNLPYTGIIRGYNHCTFSIYRFDKASLWKFCQCFSYCGNRNIIDCSQLLFTGEKSATRIITAAYSAVQITDDASIEIILAARWSPWKGSRALQGISLQCICQMLQSFLNSIYKFVKKMSQLSIHNMCILFFQDTDKICCYGDGILS